MRLPYSSETRESRVVEGSTEAARMAQELTSQRFCTLTHYVQLSVDSALVLHVHTLPEREDGALCSGSSSGASASVGLPPPFSWLAEKHIQELLVMVHEVVHDKAVRGLSSEPTTHHPHPPAAGKKNGAAGTAPDLQLKRGMNLRALFHFKSHHATQHIALPSNPSLSPLLPPTETFVNDRGRLVFESRGLTCTSGGGYRPFQVVQDALHVFVDQYEPTSHQGVIKIMMLLDPGRKQSVDVLSYFLPTRKRESSSSGEGEGEGLLTDLPVDGLKRRRGGGRGGRGGGRKATAKTGSKNKASSKTTLSRKRPVASGSHHQPTILESLAESNKSNLTPRFSRTTSRLSKPPLPPPLSGGRERKSSSDIEELFGMGAQWLSGDEEEEEKEIRRENPGFWVDSQENCTGSERSISLLSTTDLVLCGGANDENSTGGIERSDCSPTGSPSSTATSSCLSFATPQLDLPERGRDEEEMKGLERHNEEEMKGLERHNEEEMKGLERHNEEEMKGLERHNEEEMMGLERHNEEEMMGLERHNEEEIKGLERHNEEEIEWLERCNEEEIERLVRCDEEEMKGQGEQMETVTGSDSQSERGVGDRRDVSPDLWSLESECGSQPLDDITNNMSGSPALSPTSHRQRKKTLSQSSLQDCLRRGPALDETGEEESVIVIDSGDEATTSVVGLASSSQGSQGSEAQEKGRRRKKRKRKVVGPEILFNGTKELGGVPERSVSRWLAQQKELLVAIFQRKVYSRRHESFVSGTKGRAVLLHQISHHLFTKEQRDTITSGLMNAFCYKNMNLFSYVMSVLYPECLIRLIMDYHSISFDEAERKMMGLDEVVEADSDL